MTLLIAIGVIAVATAATLVSLRIVSQESELQGRERHSREAFFAAEAGLAEGREVITRLLASALKNTTTPLTGFTPVFDILRTPQMSKPGFDSDGAVFETGFVGNSLSWYEVIPATPYTLLPTDSSVDPNVTTPRRELRDYNGKPFLSFPTQAKVTYRVFVHDDTDEYSTDDTPQVDNNGAVWLVAVGEVTGATTNEVLARSVVRALVVSGRVPAAADGYGGQSGCGADKSGCSVEQTPPDASKGVVLP